MVRGGSHGSELQAGEKTVVRIVSSARIAGQNWVGKKRALTESHWMPYTLYFQECFASCCSRYTQRPIFPSAESVQAIPIGRDWLRIHEDMQATREGTSQLGAGRCPLPTYEASLVD
jgi:hypothetical protein